MEPGTRLGPYSILELLGAGGMGEVYLAEDSRLGRKVAIKVLPSEFSGDSERLVRFEQEARAAAALNHPNIAVVHDVGAEGDIHFMVQEYLQGQSLRELLQARPPKLERALSIGADVADALASAHQAGIVHRDIKPENIFIAERGHAKVLDFGLAKLMEVAAPATGTASMSATMLGTMAGQVLGTAGYMAPEQINGEDIDHRADLFAFGCVLYEAVTGKQPFVGKSIPDTLSRILHHEAEPVVEVDESLPFELQRIIKKCLVKEPAKRYQTAGDLVVDLRTLGVDVELGVALAPAGRRAAAPVAVETAGGISWKLAASGALLLAAVAAFAGWWLALPEAAVSPPQRFHIDLPAGTTLPAGRGPNITISPDGRSVVYVANGPDGRHLYLRRASLAGSTRIPGTPDAVAPTFSPDGESVAFIVGGTLLRVPLAGGEPFALCDDVNEASWGDAGELIFDRRGSLWRVPEVGGEPELVAEPRPDQGVPAFTRPHVLPGGKAVLFEPGVIGASTGAAVFSLETSEVVVVATDGSDPFYADTGHVVFARGDALLAVPFDLDRLRVTGPAVPVVQGVRVEGGGALHAEVSRNGVLAYAPGGAGGGAALLWVDRSGATMPVTTERRAYASPRFSPDGESIAVHASDGSGGDIWIVEAGPDTLRRLTTTTDARFPEWTPDGLRVTYLRDAEESQRIESTRADGTGSPKTLLDAGAGPAAHPASWTPDGGRLLVFALGNLEVLTANGDGAPSPFLQTEFITHSAELSPDGHWVAYVSDVSGFEEVYVRRFPEGGAEHRVSNGGGRAPVWSSDGSELFYKDLSQLVAVSVRTEPEWEILGRQSLFDLSFFAFVPDRFRAQYDVHPDGQRFVMLSYQPSTENVLRINVVLNWFEELKQRVPTGR